MSDILKQNLRYFIWLILLVLTAIVTINFYVIGFSKGKIYSDLDGSQNQRVGLVLGASVKSNGEPSDILRDRLDTVLLEYRQGNIKDIIVSGDNSILNYNEPQAMEAYLLKKGVNKDDIYKDYAGFDTYDSVYRTKEIFGVDSLAIFTQEYHLKRALYIADRIGIDAVGIYSDMQSYKAIKYFELREILSRVKAFIEADILRSETKYDKDIKIEIK